MIQRHEPPPGILELLRFYAEAGVDEALDDEALDRFAEAQRSTSPDAGEMSAKPTEGGAVPPANPPGTDRSLDAQRASALLSAHRGAGIPFARAEVGQPAAAVPDEAQAARARELARQAQSLEDLHAILSGFEGCNLRFTAKNLVFADGNPQARIMFVGEAPGRDEDLEGRPFVGRSGQLLDHMLAAIGLDRTSAYIANVIPWRPPGNRAPTPLETEICRPFIERQIELVNPKVIVTLGGASAKVLLATTDGVMRLRGTWRSHSTSGGVEIATMPTLHPAYLLRTPAHKKFVWRDLLEVKMKLKG